MDCQEERRIILYLERNIEERGFMEKLIKKEIIRNLILIFSVLFIIVSFFIFDTRRRVEEAGLKAVLTQMLNQYEQSKKSIEETKQHFQADYLNRTYTIEYNLENATGTITCDILRKLKKLARVESIYLVDDKGDIIYSSEESSIGLNLKESKSMDVFWSLIEGESEEAVIQFNGKSIVDDSSMIFLGIKSSIKGASMLQVGISEETYDSFIEPYSIQTIIRNIPTVEEKAIFIVNRETGEIESITENNEQEINFDNCNTKEEFVHKLENLESKFSVKVNGQLRHMKTETVDNYIFGVYIDTHLIYNGAINELIMLFVFVVSVLYIIYYLVRKSIQKFVLNDLNLIDKNIEKLLYGDYNIHFESYYDTEFKKLNIILERWKQSYQHKAERMTRLISNINEELALFESLSSIHRVFFSENLAELLNLNKEEETELKSNPEKFESCINKLISNMDENGIVRSGNRYLSLKVFKEEKEVYGIIVDRTRELMELNKIKNRLEITEEKVYRDMMCGVYNREGLEILVRKSLMNHLQGLLIIFDIDNFKAINDNEGHPKGDEVLIRFANCLKEAYRGDDIVARMGGDEFAVYIKDNLSHELVRKKCEFVLQQLREELQEYYIKYNVSASIGIAYVSEEVKTYELLYHKADCALYIAKKQGKNTYCISEDSIEKINDSCTEKSK